MKGLLVPLALLAALAVLALTGAAHAGASRVAIVRPARSDAAIQEATTRVSAELGAAGFEVVLVDATPGVDARAQVEATRIDPRPFATIAILGTERGAVADVWVADHLSAKTLVRRVDVADAASAAAPAALAIRAVELLRASLLEIGSQPAAGAAPLPADVARWMGKVAPTAPVAPPGPPVFPIIPLQPAPPAPAPVTPPPPREISEPAPARRGPRPALLAPPSVEGAGALLHSFSGFGPTLAPSLRISGSLPRGLAGRVSFVGPAFGASLESGGSTATLHQELLELEILYVIGGTDADLVPVVSAGAGGYHLHASGTAAPGLRGQSVEAWAFAADVGAGIAGRLGADVALLFDLHALGVAPDPIVRVAGKEVARGGFPRLLASIGVVIAF